MPVDAPARRASTWSNSPRSSRCAIRTRAGAAAREGRDAVPAVTPDGAGARAPRLEPRLQPAVPDTAAHPQPLLRIPRIAMANRNDRRGRAVSASPRTPDQQGPARPATRPAVARSRATSTAAVRVISRVRPIRDPRPNSMTAGCLRRATSCQVRAEPSPPRRAARPRHGVPAGPGTDRREPPATLAVEATTHRRPQVVQRRGVARCVLKDGSEQRAQQNE